MRASGLAKVSQDPAVVQLSHRINLLRCAALYGANASGKSNLVEAMQFARSMIVAEPAAKDAAIVVHPFRLDEASRQLPSVFEFVFFAAGSIYEYQFSVNRREVVHERIAILSTDDPTQERELFRREGAEFTFSPSFRASTEDPKFLDYVARGTRANQLFLNEAYERDIGPLLPIYRWFFSTLIIIKPDTRYGPLVEDAEREPRFKEFLKGVLEWADTGIIGVDTRRSKVDDGVKKEVDAIRKSKRARPLLQELARLNPTRDALIELEDGQAEVLSLHFQHRSDAGSEFMDVDDESDGTMRLLDLAPMLYLAKEHAPVYVVDELDRSLHTILAQRLVERFITETGGGGTAPLPQLIFTTHDTNLLDCHRLTPECIWFAEKNRSGASEFYSLGEYDPEQIREMCGSLEKGYLQGRFGGIPFLGSPERLGWMEPRTPTPDEV
jgi:AAA15 family ATPase/GTPase